MALVEASQGRSGNLADTVRMLCYGFDPMAGIYSLSATGLVVVYSTTGVFNFAQGAIGMMAAYVYWQFVVQWGWPSWLACTVHRA